MGINTSTNFDHATKNSKEKSKSIYFFVGFLIVSFVAAFIIGGIILGREKTKKQNAATEVKEQVKLTASELPDNPDSWASYQMPEVGMEVKLPKKLVKLGEWKTEEREGEKGAVLCFNVYGKTSFVPSLVYAGGAGICGGNGKDILIIGGSSKDFEAGREGMFTDLQGFTNENGVYYANFVDGKKIELKNVKFKEFDNGNGMEIIKILGEDEEIEGDKYRVPGTPGEGYLGAIVNTKNLKYPGLSLQLKLDSDISEYEFDQILRSLKFKDQ